MPLKSRDLIDASDPRVAQIGHPAPPWLVNYADLMTEIVCFFVILYAVSAALNKGVQEAKKQVEETMKEEKIQGEVKVNKEGMQITIEEKGENVFFESGSAELSPRPAGVYQARIAVNGLATRIGWAVLPDGTQAGVAVAGTTKSPAPPLDLSNNSFTLGGTTFTAAPVAGNQTVVIP